MITVETFRDHQFKVINGTFYNMKTKEEMIVLLEKLRGSGRYIIEYGDTETGRCWNHEEDGHREVGKIGRTMGPVKSLILVYNSRSYGGDYLISDKIVRIRRSIGKSVVYKHPNFHYTSQEFENWRGKVCVLLAGYTNTVGGTVNQQGAFNLSYSGRAEALFLEGVEPQAATDRLSV